MPRATLSTTTGSTISASKTFTFRAMRGNFKTYDTHIDAFEDTMDTMRKLIPTHVVFNGRVGP